MGRSEASLDAERDPRHLPLSYLPPSLPQCDGTCAQTSGSDGIVGGHVVYFTRMECQVSQELYLVVGIINELLKILENTSYS